MNVVFVGPTLAGDRTPRPDIDFRPPAEAGDLYRAARDGAEVIGLIDGVFDDRPTVWHKEILWALDRGVRVLGAASLGALRAAECADFGMEGVGEIYARCRSGALEDDHELALAHAPRELGYAALSEPLVNLRATLDAAAAARLIRRTAGAAMLRHAAALPYRDLVWERLLQHAIALGWSGAERQRFTAWLPGGRVDLKRADALALLDALAAPPPPRVASPGFACTRYWQAAVAHFDAAGPASRADEAVLDELRLDPARYERTLVRAFARRAARDRPLPPGRAAELLDDLRLDFGLATAADFHAWLASVHTDEAAIGTALAGEERLALALEADAPMLAADMLDALRAEGRFETLAARAADKRRQLGALPPSAGNAGDLATLIDELCARRRVRIDSDDPEVAAHALGLPDAHALHRLLWQEAAYLATLPEEDP